MKACDLIARSLHQRGVKVVFGLIGGMIAFLVESLSRHQKIVFITFHHEQAAAFAADAYGRMTGSPTVVMATSGPGATNLITGIGSCYFDYGPGQPRRVKVQKACAPAWFSGNGHCDPGAFPDQECKDGQ